MSSSIKGYEKIAKTLKNLDSKSANKVVRRGVSKMAQVVRKEMRRNAPRRTGQLNKELRYKVSRDRQGGFTAQVGAFNKAYYAAFLENGTKPHKIPKKKGAKVVLNGRVVQNINHPGTKGSKFISKSFQKSRKRAVEEGGKVMFQLMAKL
tara:strand:+ start:11933 stop:12382 length:450 start_codon:yes stop_codon:yes gene_type:complete